MPHSPNRLFTWWTMPAWGILASEAIVAIRKLFGWWGEGEFLYGKESVVIDFFLSPHGQLIVIVVCIGFLFYSSRKHDRQASGTPVGTIRLADAVVHVVQAFNETQTLPIADIAERAVGRDNILVYYANYLAEGSKLFAIRAPATEHKEIQDVALALAQGRFADDGDTIMLLSTREDYRDIRIRKKDFSRALDEMKRETDTEPVRAEPEQTGDGDISEESHSSGGIAAVSTAPGVIGEAALAEYKATLEEAREVLDELEGEFSPQELAKAYEGLEKDDPTNAETLFRRILAAGSTVSVLGSREKALKAALMLSRLAEGHGDDQAALRYHKQAMELKPSGLTGQGYGVGGDDTPKVIVALSTLQPSKRTISGIHEATGVNESTIEQNLEWLENNGLAVKSETDSPYWRLTLKGREVFANRILAEMKRET